MACNAPEPCWICLDDASSESNQLIKPCACARYVHTKCLARRQLQSAGKTEETAHRFRHQALPGGKRPATTDAAAKALPAVMAVVCGEQVHQLAVPPQGKEGRQQFMAQVRAIFGLPANADFEVVFEAKHPVTGERLTLDEISGNSPAPNDRVAGPLESTEDQQLDAAFEIWWSLHGTLSCCLSATPSSFAQRFNPAASAATDVIRTFSRRGMRPASGRTLNFEVQQAPKKQQQQRPASAAAAAEDATFHRHATRMWSAYRKQQAVIVATCTQQQQCGALSPASGRMGSSNGRISFAF